MGPVIVVQMPVAYIDILAVQQTFIGHGHVRKNADTFFPGVAFELQLPFAGFVPGMRLNASRVQSLPVVYDQPGENLFFQPCPVVVSFRNAIDGFTHAILKYVVGGEQHHVQRHGGLGKRIVDELQHVFIRPVVAVHITDIIPPSRQDARVPRGNEAAVGFVDDLHAGILLRVFIADLRAAVRRTVVDQKHFKIAIGLIQNAVHTTMQVFFHIINGHDHAEHRFSPSF